MKIKKVRPDKPLKEPKEGKKRGPKGPRLPKDSQELKKRTPKPKKFKDNWLVDYFFIQNNEAGVCLICKKSVSVLREFNLSRHYRTLHEKEYQQYTGSEREEKAHTLKEDFLSQEPLQEDGSANAEALAKISFRVVELMAKHDVSLTDGDFVKECIHTFSGFVCPTVQPIAQNIYLSPNYITTKIQELSEGIKEYLLEVTSRSPVYSLSLVGVAPTEYSAQLYLYVRGFSKNYQLFEELLDILPVTELTTGHDIYTFVKDRLTAHELPLANLSGFFTEGAPVLSSRCQECVTLLTPELPAGVFLHQDMPFQEQLCGSIKFLDRVIKKVTSIINFISSKGIPPLPLQHFIRADTDLSDIYYNGLRWPALFSNLSHFWDARAEIKTFLVENSQDIEFLVDESWVNDLAFLLDISKLLSDLAHQLQEKHQFIHHMYCHYFAFTKKLELLHSQLSANQLALFPRLQKRPPNPTRFQAYSEFLNTLGTIFKNRSTISPETLMNINTFSDPFSVDASQVPLRYQLELLALQTHPDTKRTFRDHDLVTFYQKTTDKEDSPHLFANAFKTMSLFGNTHHHDHLVTKLNQIKRNAPTASTDLQLGILRIASSQVHTNLNHFVPNGAT